MFRSTNRLLSPYLKVPFLKLRTLSSTQLHNWKTDDFSIEWLLRATLEDGSDKVLSRLIEMGVNVVDTHSSFTSLQILANRVSHSGHIRSMKILIAKGFDVNAVDDNPHDANDPHRGTWKLSALSRVIYFSYGRNEDIILEAVKLLISHGANPNIDDIWGKTSLHRAAENQKDSESRFAIINYLLDNPHNRACITQINKQRENVGHIVAKQQTVDLKLMQYYTKSWC